MPERSDDARHLLAHYAENRATYQETVVPPIFQNSLFILRKPGSHR